MNKTNFFIFVPVTTRGFPWHILRRRGTFGRPWQAEQYKPQLLFDFCCGGKSAAATEWTSVSCLFRQSFSFVFLLTFSTQASACESKTTRQKRKRRENGSETNVTLVGDCRHDEMKLKQNSFKTVSKLFSLFCFGFISLRAQFKTLQMYNLNLSEIETNRYRTFCLQLW